MFAIIVQLVGLQPSLCFRALHAGCSILAGTTPGSPAISTQAMVLLGQLTSILLICLDLTQT